MISKRHLGFALRLTLELSFASHLHAVEPAYAIQFNQPRYDISPGESFIATVQINPLPVEKLFSFGARVSFPSTNAEVHAISNILTEALLDFNGVAGPNALRLVGFGGAAAKGTIDTFAPVLAPTHNSALVSLSITDSSSTKYTLTLGPFNTLGPTEQIFVTGEGVILDGRLQFGSALVNHRPYAVFVTPLTNTPIRSATVRVEAGAWDFDGEIARLEFLEDGISMAAFTNRPFSKTLTNLAVGLHRLSLRAYDDSGAITTNSITFTVLGPPVTYVLSPLILDRQTGLFRQSVRIVNNQEVDITSFFLRVHGLPAGARLWNASGIANGVPFLGYNSRIPSGSNVQFTLEFYIPDRQTNQPPTCRLRRIAARTQRCGRQIRQELTPSRRIVLSRVPERTRPRLRDSIQWRPQALADGRSHNSWQRHNASMD